MPRGIKKEPGLTLAPGCRAKGFKEANPGIWRAYISWMSLWLRVSGKNPNDRTYKKKDITVCERWKFFWNFFEDMGERPEGMEIDRIENGGNYEPGNCRWATKIENNNNREDNRWIEYNGMRMNHNQWSLFLGGFRTLVEKRIRELGWSKERAVSTPVRKYRPRKK